MTAKIITVCNQKGGSGKTNLAMTLAGSLGSRDFRTLLIDGDIQGTATRWFATAPDDKKFPAEVINLAAAGGQIARPMKDYVNQYDVIVVDTPPSVRDPVTLATLLLADLALVPMIPSPGDLWATSTLIQVIEQATGINTALQVLVVPNGVQSTTLADAALEALQSIGLPVAKSYLTLRTSYRQAIAEGTTVLGLRDAKAIEESEELVDETLALLSMPLKLTKAPRLVSHNGGGAR